MWGRSPYIPMPSWLVFRTDEIAEICAVLKLEKGPDALIDSADHFGLLADRDVFLYIVHSNCSKYTKKIINRDTTPRNRWFRR